MMMTSTIGKTLAIVAIIVVGGLVLLQLAPYGRDHTNPAVITEPPWDSPETRAQFMQSCGDCHSNETTWPWYSNIAPISWLVYHDVVEGREHMNVSEWGSGEDHSDDAAEMVIRGQMPLPVYLILHPSARLTSEQKQALADGLAATFGGGGEHEHGDGD